MFWFPRVSDLDDLGLKIRRFLRFLVYNGKLGVDSNRSYLEIERTVGDDLFTVVELRVVAMQRWGDRLDWMRLS